jgi:hypothetical protein
MGNSHGWIQFASRLLLPQKECGACFCHVDMFVSSNPTSWSTCWLSRVEHVPLTLLCSVCSASLYMVYTPFHCHGIPDLLLSSLYQEALILIRIVWILLYRSSSHMGMVRCTTRCHRAWCLLLLHIALPMHQFFWEPNLFQRLIEWDRLWDTKVGTIHRTEAHLTSVT